MVEGETLDALLRACVVQVLTPGQEGNGTGFFVAPGRILTCAHVVTGAEPGQTPITVLWRQQEYMATVLQRAAPTNAESDCPDLALLALDLELSSDLQGHPCVALLDEVKLGDDLYAYGYSYAPHQWEAAKADSVTSQYEGPSDEGRLYKFKAGQIESGLSGGPLLNVRTGAVCGVVKSTRDDRADLGGRAVPVATVWQVFPALTTLQQTFHANDPRWRTAQRVSATPNPALTIFQVPYGKSACLGRKDTLEALETLLVPASATVAVTGLGGIGKTLVAATYAHRARTRYPGGVFWLRMDDPVDVAVQVVTCGGPGGLDLPGWEVADFEGRVRLVQAAWRQEVPRLLVFDNLEDPALIGEWRPTTGGCRVVLTSRREQWPPWSGVRTVPLTELARQASQELLCLTRAEVTGVRLEEVMADPAVDAICEEVGDLPLALAVAGAYLATYPTLSMGNFLNKLRAEALAHGALTGHLEGELPTRHSGNVAATFALSYEPLRQGAQLGDELALTLVHRAALLAPAPIPRRLLIRAADCDPDAVEEDGPEADALRRLSGLGLVQMDTHDTIRLHRLVAAFVRAQPYASQRRSETSKLLQLWTRFKRTKPNIAKANSETDNYAAVVNALTIEVDTSHKSGYRQAGVPYVPHLRRVIEANGQRDDGFLVMSLANLACLLQDQGEYGAARPLFGRALAISEQVLGPKHSITARSLSDLARLLQDQGEYAPARPLFARALAIREIELGPGHPDTASSLDNLASLLLAHGDAVAACPLFARALAIREQALGPEHPDVAISLNSLAMLLHAQRDYAAARAFLERALAIREAALGPKHPDTAINLNNLAMLLHDQGDYATARVLLKRAVSIANEVWGSTHPNTAALRANLALL